MTLSGGSIVGLVHNAFMNLRYGAQIQRLTATYTPIGSMNSNYTTLPTVLPCDVSPMSDDTVMQQFGQQDRLTHVLHFQAGTDIRTKDQVLIRYAPQPGNFGNVGDVYFISEVLQPSTDLNYVRCRARKAQVVTG
jgi:hypothetical protein